MSGSVWFVDDCSGKGASGPTNTLTAQLARSTLCNMKSLSLSDRERAELRGPVKAIVDNWSTTVFDRDGKILEWRGNTSHGRSERTYFYDENGKLIRITGSDGDQVDEFHYNGQGKTQIRHVPPRPDQQSRAFGVSVWFDAISEGEGFTDGGTVETTYNERDEPLEKRLFDDEGTLLFRIVHIYGANGRLGEERLISENFSLPRAFRDQIPSAERAAVLAQIKMERESISQRTGLFGNAERAYVYNERGHVAERHMRQGSIREDVTFSYNERGDISEKLTIQTSRFPHEASVETQLLKLRRTYEYDTFGNWTIMTQTSESGGNAATRQHNRQLTYHQ